MLNDAKLMAFGATANPMRSRHFYQSVLGLALVEDSPFALVFDANGTELRVQKVDSVSPGSYTALGWAVADIERSVQALSGKGVSFERFPGMQQDALGIWQAPGGAKVAWFRDPDGNLLSLAQHAAA